MPEMMQHIVFEPAQTKYNETYATSEDSDQPVHPHSLIRVFTDRMWLLQPAGYLKRDEREPLAYWVDMYRLTWVFGHTGLLVGFIVRCLIYP